MHLRLGEFARVHVGISLHLMLCIRSRLGTIARLVF